MIMTGMVMDMSDFETDTDGWITPAEAYGATSGVASFTRDSGGTTSFSTGPSTGAGGSTWYMYCETSTPYSSAAFGMQKSFPAGQELYGISFWYHKYGSTIGTSYLETSADGTSGSWTSLWSKTGDQGDSWQQATVYAPGTDQTSLRFTCVPLLL